VARVERIGDDIFVLTDNVPVGADISWVESSATGFEPYNEYVIRSSDRALLIDTGVAIHQRSIMSSLVEIVGERELAIFTTRIELDCIGNLGAILDVFPGAQVVTTIPIAPTLLVHVGKSTPPPRPVLTLCVGSTLENVGFGRCKTVSPLIQTLGTCWLLDGQSGTLFTSDSFCADLLKTENQPLLQTENADGLTTKYVRGAVLSKFDWLEAADLAPLAARWDDFFRIVQPNMIAPIHGRIPHGPRAVSAAIDIYRGALFSAAAAN
jgi:flavorubredoxin